MNKKKRLLDFFATRSNPVLTGGDRDIEEALYSLGKEGCFPDFVDSVSIAQAVML